MGKYASVVLAIWLILTGAVSALDLSFAYIHIVLGGLAIAAGVLILLKK
jgi:hypothetical protein